VLSVLVGYTGGSTPDPTYRNLGDHSEAVEVRFDPQQVSYRRLLEAFWEYHRPLAPAYARQYRSAVFYRTPEQKRLAEQVKIWLEQERSVPLYTAIEPAGVFYPAEDYHQKYTLQHHTVLMDALQDLYPDRAALFRSTVAARLNAALAGDASLAPIRAAFELENVSAEKRLELERLLKQ
jgi:peptide-methionine (S)-S-oxide reductase